MGRGWAGVTPLSSNECNIARARRGEGEGRSSRGGSSADKSNAVSLDFSSCWEREKKKEKMNE